MAPSAPAYVAGMDVGATPNNGDGFAYVQQKLERLGVLAAEVRLGLEATGAYWENLYYYLTRLGYGVVLLHPGQTHEFAAQRGLHAKTARRDATTIARLLLSAEVRPAYVPDEQIATYRELVRLHRDLSETAARYQLQIQDQLHVLFPEFSQVFADPCRPTATALLGRYPSAAAFAEAGVAAVTVSLQELAPRRYGARSAQHLVALARHSVASGLARAARERRLGIMLAQWAATAQHLAAGTSELAALVAGDEGADGLSSVSDFGPKTTALLRAEWGDVQRFADSAQAVADVGRDVQVRQSGQGRGRRKLAKRGSGRGRRVLYGAAGRSISRAGAAFGSYYRHLVGQGVAKMSALIAQRCVAHGGDAQDGGGGLSPVKERGPL